MITDVPSNQVWACGYAGNINATYNKWGIPATGTSPAPNWFVILTEQCTVIYNNYQSTWVYAPNGLSTSVFLATSDTNENFLAYGPNDTDLIQWASG